MTAGNFGLNMPQYKVQSQRPAGFWQKQTGRKTHAKKLNAVSNQYVVSLGEALFDMLADQPDVPKEKVTSWTPYVGGAPTNLATGMSRLNIDTHVVTKVGRDKLGQNMMRFFQEECKDRSININSIQRSDDPTRDVLVTRRSNGDVNFSGFSQPKDSYADCFINKDDIPPQLLGNSSILVTGTLGLAFPKTREAMEHAVNQVNGAKVNTNGNLGRVEGIYVSGDQIIQSPSLQHQSDSENGYMYNVQAQKGLAENDGRSLQSKVFVDLNWRPVFFDDPVSAKMMIENYLQKADYMKVTAEEAEWLTGINKNVAFENPQVMFDHFPNTKLVLISNGGKGASYAYHYKETVLQGVQPAFKITPVDTCGAGDSFNSGFMAYLLQNYHLNDFNYLDKEDWDKALNFAIGTSALTCLGKGAIAPQPTYGQVLNFLEEQRVKEAAPVLV